jgi:RNA polymerase sigma factor (sigma-70 family)
MVRVDQGAFEEWVGARLSPLVRFGFALTHDEGGAEDLVESALVRTMLAWPELHVSGDPEAYARRMMVAEQEGTWRRPRRRPEPAAARGDLGFAEVAPEEVELVERDRVWRELVDLPPRQRAVLVLRFYEGRSERDVAAVLACSVAMVANETREAIDTLRAGQIVDRLARR